MGWKRGQMPLNHTYLQYGEELGNGDSKEVEIEKKLELLIQNYKQESCRVVFLIAHNIWWVVFHFVIWIRFRSIRFHCR